jgi:hypothetical protein
MNNVAPTTIGIERLKELLFHSEAQSVYGVLDGASVPGLLERLAGAKEEYACLYRGELGQDLAEAAPYLIKLRRQSPLTEWMLSEGWGQHWGIFASSPLGLEALRRHFRGFLRVKNPQGKILYFRYYDPRVLRAYLPTCNRAETRTVFGPVTRYLVEAAEPGTAIEFVTDPATARPSQRNVPLATPNSA